MDSALGRRFYLLFFIDIPTRHLTLAAITTNPTGTWTTQAARNLLATSSEAFKRCKMLVRDRAGQFTASFAENFHTEAIASRRPVADAGGELLHRTLDPRPAPRTTRPHHPLARTTSSSAGSSSTTTRIGAIATGVGHFGSNCPARASRWLIGGR